VEEPGNGIDRIGGLRLQSLLRGLRSRKPSVRAWALEEASRLDAPHKMQFDAMVERSFKEEAGRRRFWRFMAFYGSPLIAGFAAAGLRHLIPEVSFPIGHETVPLGGKELADLVSFIGWLALWMVSDRAAKRAFVLPEDGRALWQQRRKGEARESGVLDAPAQAPMPPAHVEAFAQELTDVLTPVREAARQKAALFPEEDLLAAARLLVERYTQSVERETHKRSRLSNLAFWLFVAGVFTDLWILLLAVLGFGLYALYYRDEAPHRHLDALAAVLDELAKWGTPVSLSALCPSLDPAAAERMQRQCPVLGRFLPEKPPSPELTERLDTQFSGVLYSPDQGLIVRAAVLSPEESEALREASAEVLLAPFDDVEETLVALKRLEEIGDEAVIPMLQRLAAQPLRFLSVRAPLRTVREYRQDVQRVREAARACLGVLQARVDVQQRTLLRPSEAARADTLLRPAETDSKDHLPEELLRPGDNPVQTSGTVIAMESHVSVNAEEKILPLSSSDG